MSSDLIDSVARTTERKRFLARAGGATLALVAGAFARPSTASAIYPTRGCNLCQAPTTCSGRACYWCWWGNCYGGKRYQCCEGYTSTSGCDGNCTASNFSCSRVGGTRAC